MQTSIKVGDFRALIAESSNEFKAKLGDGVESKNKSINDKAYTDAKKRAKDFDGGLEDEVGSKHVDYVKDDFNRTTLDYDINSASPEYKKRVKAQVKGYTSAAEESNGIEKVGDRKGNENVYNGIKKSSDAYHKAEKDLKKSGLQAREWPDEVFDKDDMFENVQTVRFKKTKFLTEGHMVSRIPDAMKVEGKCFKMVDCNDNTYLIEWKNNRAFVQGRKDMKMVNESVARMKELMGYNPNSYVEGSRANERVNENRGRYDKTLDIARKITKQN